MEFIKNWAFSVCSAAICGSVMYLVLPEGNLQKVFKTVFCMFFLCTVISPFAEIKIPDFDKITLQTTEEKALENNIFNETTEKHIEEQIIYDTDSVLFEENLFAEDILVKVNILPDGSIEINKFILTICSIEDSEKLKDKIYQRTGIKPEIIFSGEN